MLACAATIERMGTTNGIDDNGRLYHQRAASSNEQPASEQRMSEQTRWKQATSYKQASNKKVSRKRRCTKSLLFHSLSFFLSPSIQIRLESQSHSSIPNTNTVPIHYITILYNVDGCTSTTAFTSPPTSTPTAYKYIVMLWW